MKEIRIRALAEDNKEGKMIAYIFFFQPILCILVAIFMIYMNKEVFKNDLIFQIAIGGFILLVILVFFLNNIPNIANGVLTEEICYIENKIFYYTKTRNFLGMKKVIKSFQIPIVEISNVKENMEKVKLNIFSMFKPRNSVEIETRDGKKYQIMNSVVFGNRNSLNPTSGITNERTNKIYNEVKNMISK